MILVKDLSKTFGDIDAVKGINFEVKKGEVVGFLGPNGAGKSTTMRMLTGYLNPSGGTIEIAGLDSKEKSIEIRQKIGYLPEDAPVYVDMDVIDYLEYVSEIRGIPKATRLSKIKEISELCGISKELYRGISELSKGYRQRVGLAQALIHNPDILILDEPTSGLDPNQIAEIRDLIKEIGKDRTVMLSTHILSEVQATCNRAIIISKGRIVADSTIEELQKSASEMTVYKIELNAPADTALEVISKIDGISNAQVTDQKANSIFITFNSEKNKDPRTELFKNVVDNGWELLGLKKEVVGLEDIFRQLTTENGGK